MIYEGGRWVGAWASAQYYGDAGSANDGIRGAGIVARDMLSNSTLRQVVRTAIAGGAVRLAFSNEFGGAPLHINAASIARACGVMGSSDIDTATSMPVTFGGGVSVTIPPGGRVVSDIVSISVKALERIAVSVFFGDMPEKVTSHIASRANSFTQPGNCILDAAVTGGVNTHWFTLCGLDVLAPPEARSVVAFGDSITDGYGVTDEAYTRWVDVLMERLQGNDATRRLSVVNMGIGGNMLLGSASSNPPAARRLYTRDILNQPGAGYAIIEIGVNDLAYAPKLDIRDMKEAYSEIYAAARAEGIKVFACTITPYNESKEQREADRNTLNDWIRRQYADGLTAGLVDFDKLLRDPDNPRRMLPAYDRDGIHPTDYGYRQMGGMVYELLRADTE